MQMFMLNWRQPLEAEAAFLFCGEVAKEVAAILFHSHHPYLYIHASNAYIFPAPDDTRRNGK